MRVAEVSNLSTSSRVPHIYQGSMVAGVGLTSCIPRSTQQAATAALTTACLATSPFLCCPPLTASRAQPPARQRDADGARCCQRGSLGGTSVSPPEAATPAVATALASLSDDPLRRSSDAPLAPHPAAAHGDCLCVRAAASVA